MASSRPFRSDPASHSRAGCAPALWALTCLFALRVAGQAIQHSAPVPWLPPLEAWQGSRLPYWALLSIQITILGLMARWAARVGSGCARRKPGAGKLLLILGTIYFLGMATRLVIGLADLSPAAWFHRPIPSVFHLVLASFVLVLGAWHRDLPPCTTRPPG